MREEAAGRHVDRIDAGLDQPLAHLHGVLEGVARRPPPEERHRIVVIDRADLHLQVEVVADARRGSRLNDLEDEARAVLERAAVVVLPVVDGRAQELRDQVAVGAVQLDAVEAGLAGAPRAVGEVLHDLVDLRRWSSARSWKPWIGSRLSVELRPFGYSMPLMSRWRPPWLSCRMNLQSCACTALPTSRQNGIRASLSIIA